MSPSLPLGCTSFHRIYHSGMNRFITYANDPDNDLEYEN